MNSKILHLIIFIGFIVVFCQQTIQGQSVKGAELSYQYLTTNTYEVVLDVYADCSKLPLGANQTINITAPSCGISSGTMLVNLQSGFPSDISPICLDSANTCNGGNFLGIEHYQYKGLATITNTCSDVVFSWDYFHRQAGINTLTLPAMQGIHIEASLDAMIGTNNSAPEFLYEPLFFTCLNQVVTYNNRAIDADGDSLVYALVDCQKSVGLSVDYSGTYSGVNPFSFNLPNLSIDPQTGAITFNANGANNNVLTCVQVDEYRGGVKIGSIVRDVQLKMGTCTNTLPTITGINGSTKYQINALENKPLSFYVIANDLNNNNATILDLTYENSIAGATFAQQPDPTIGPHAIRGVFNWVPTAADLGEHLFTLEIEDGNCPRLGKAVTTYTVRVLPAASSGVVDAGPDLTICLGDSAQLDVTSGAVTYQWTPAIGLSDATLKNPKASPPTTTTYQVLATNSDGTTSTDQVVVNVLALPMALIDTQTTTTHLCHGGDIHLFSASLGPIRYHWNGPNGFLSNLQNPSIYGATSIHEGYYYLQIEDTITGCYSGYDSIYVDVHAMPSAPFIAGPGTTCSGNAFRIDELLWVSCDSFSWIGPMGPQPGTPSFVEVYPGDANYRTGMWVLQCIDTVAGCITTSDPEFVVVDPTPPPPVPTSNGPICIGDTLKLSAPLVLTANANWYSNPGGTFFVNSGPTISIVGVTTDTTFYVQYRTPNGCRSTIEAISVQVLPPAATPDISPDLTICEGDEIYLYTNSTSVDSFLWTHATRVLPNQPDFSIDPSILADSGIYNLAIVDTNGCRSLDTSVHVTIHPKPIAPMAVSNSPICEGETLQLFHIGGCDESHWIAPNGAIIIQTTDTLSIAAATSNYLAGDWIFLCVDTLTGCIDSSNVVNVQINPVPPIVSTFNNGPICIGDSVRVGAALLGGASYQWYADSLLTIPIVGGVGPSVIIPNITTDSIFYVATQRANCFSVGQTLVEVHPPSAQPNISPDFDVCEGDTIFLGTTSPADDYFWTVPSGGIINAQNIAVIAFNTGAYLLSIVDTNGCPVPDTSVFITVQPQPTPPTLVGPPICEGEPLMLVALGACDSIEWVDPFGATFVDIDTIIILPGDPNYIDGGIWRAQCINTTTNCQSLVSLSHTARIRRIPNRPTINNNSPVCIGESVTLSTPMIGGATYKWYTADSTLYINAGALVTIPNITTDSLFLLSIEINGCTNSDTTHVLVYPQPPTPALPNSIEVCELDSIQFMTAPQTAYTWTGPNGFYSNQQNPFIYPATLADSGKYTLSIKDANFCSSEDTAVQVIVHALPLAPIITAQSTAICAGDSLFISSNTTCGKLEWEGPTGVLFLAGDSIVIDSLHPDYQNGNWTVLCMDTVTGCASRSNPLTITIKSIPALPILANTSPICEGGDVDLSMSLVAGASYQWYALDSTLIDTVPTVTIAGLNNDTIFYGVVTVNGCSNFDTTHVSVIPKPNPPNIMAQEDTLCSSSFIQFGINPPTNLSFTYNWTGPNGYVDTGIAPFISPIDTIHTGTYFLNAVDVNGCVSLDTSIFILVQSLPQKPVITGTSVLCQGDSIRLEGPTCDSLVWNNLAFSALVSVVGSPYLTIGPGMVGYDTLEHWQVRCFDRTTGCVSPYSDAFQVSVNPLPIGITPTNSGPVCFNGSATLSIPQQTNPSTYLWSTDSLMIDTIGTGTTIVVDNIITDSTFYVQVTDALGCSSIGSTTIFLSTPPIVPNATTVDSVLCEGGSFMLLELGYPMVGYDYSWTGPNGFVSIDKFPTISTATVNQAGFYTVVVIDSNGCASPSDSVYVRVNALPTKPTIVGGGNICYGSPIVLTSSSNCDSMAWLSPVHTIANAGNQLTLNTLDSGYTNTTWTLLCYDTTSGCFDTSNAVFVNLVPAPSLPIIDNNNPICYGDSAVFTTLPVLGATNIWYSDALLTDSIGAGDTLIIHNITSDSVVFLQQTVNACTAPIASDTALSLPVPPIPIVGADITVCAGEPIALTSGTPADAYWWTHPNGFNATLQNPIIPAATLADTGIYTLTLIDTNGCVAPSAFIKVSVNLPPPLPIIFADDTICQGDTMTLGCSPGSPNIISQWITPINTILNDSIIHILNSSIHYKAGLWRLIYTDTITGCESIADTIITIDTIPNPGIILNTGPVCIGDSVTLATTQISGARTYVWYRSDTTIIGYGQTIRIPNIVSDTFFGLVIRTNAGCGYFMDTNFVSVHPPLSSPPIVADTNNCVGDLLSLTTNAASGYTWTGPNGVFSYQQNPTIGPLSPADSGLYQLTIEGVNGCTSPSTTLHIAVHASPLAPIATSLSPICNGDTLYLNATTTGTCDTAYWIGPGNSTITGMNATIPADSLHYLSGNWQLFCVDTTTTCQTGSNIITSIIQTLPTINTINNGPICIGDSVQLTASIVAGANYFWYSDSLLTDTIGTSRSIWVDSILSDSTFYVTAVDTNGCSSTIASTQVLVHPMVIAPLVGADIQICEGDAIRLSTGTLAAGYHWTGPNNYSSNRANPTIFNATSVHTGTYSLSTQSINGCNSAPATLQVTVDSLPTPPTIGGFVYLCAGDSLFLNSDSTASHCDSMQWVGPNGVVAGANVAISSSDSTYSGGLWRLQCMDTTTGCWSESNPSVVIIYTTPDTQATFNNGPVCIGGDVLLNTPTAGALASYTWYADSLLTNISGTGQNPTIGGIISDTTFYLVITNGGGCTSAPIPSPVTVLPLGNAPIVPTDTQYCEGDHIILTTPTLASTYYWTSSNGFSDSLQSSTVTISATVLDSGTYSLMVRDTNNCLSATASFHLSINPLPVSPVLISNSPLCDGDTLRLSSSGQCGQAQWIGPYGNNPATLGSPGGANHLWTIGSTTFIPPSDSNYGTNNWYMICIDTLTGCRATSNTIAVTIDAAPAINAISNTGPICLGDTVELSIAASSTSGTSPFVTWYTDALMSNAVATGLNPILPYISTTTTFYAQVMDTVTGCIAYDSTRVVVHPVPLAPVLPTNIILCEGDSLALTTSTIANAYHWTGPNGFTSNLQNPTAFAASILDSGTYSLSIIDSNACQSSTGNVQVVVNPIPNTPIVINNSPACTGDSILLMASAIVGATYEWFKLPSNTSVGQGQNYTLTNVTLADTGSYYVMATINGCSTSSSATVVTVYPNSTAIAVAGPDQSLCALDSTTLTAVPPSVNVIGTWTTNSGATIVNPNQASTLVANLSVGTHTFYWTLSNATCPSISTDSVVVSVTALSSDIANAGIDQHLCGDSIAMLSGNTPTSSTGRWTQTIAQANLGVTIVNASNPSTAINGLNPGNRYQFVWEFENGDCGVHSTDTVAITIDIAPTIPAVAGTDIITCHQDTIVLSATNPSVGTGLWTTTSSAIIITPSQHNTIVTNLLQDTTLLVWTLSNGACLNYASDSMLIVLGGANPIANPDNLGNLTSNASVVVNVIPNDILTNNWDIYIHTPMSNGQMINLNNGQFELNLQGVMGAQQFIYELCNPACPANCDTALVVLEVLPVGDCDIPNIFTPNGDGVNDVFEIPCLEGNQAAWLNVFNRWGDLVYETDNYQNQWDGTHLGKALPDGTYFYIIKIENGRQLQGSVEIRR